MFVGCLHIPTSVEGSTAMDPKKLLIRPKTTAEADERKAAAEAAEAEKQASAEGHAKACAKVCDEEPTLQDVDQFLSEAEKDPEKVKAAGEKIGVDYSFIADHATAMKGGFKKYAGKPLSEKEESALAEQGSFLKKAIEKDFQEESPEERAETVKLVEKMLRPFPRAIREKLLKEFKMVVSDAPSEASEENDKENA